MTRDLRSSRACPRSLVRRSKVTGPFFKHLFHHLTIWEMRLAFHFKNSQIDLVHSTGSYPGFPSMKRSITIPP